MFRNPIRLRTPAMALTYADSTSLGTTNQLHCTYVTTLASFARVAIARDLRGERRAAVSGRSDMQCVSVTAIT